LGQEKPLTVKG